MDEDWESEEIPAPEELDHDAPEEELFAVGGEVSEESAVPEGAPDAANPPLDSAEAQAQAFYERVWSEAPNQEADAQGEARPALLRAVEGLLIDPEELALDVEKLRVRLRKRHQGDALRRAVAHQLIDVYSRKAMAVGGATALFGVVPGLGTVASLGGALTDAAMSMKYEIELVQGIAIAYGRDVTVEEERRACMAIAGLGTLVELGKFTGKRLTTEAFVRAVQKFLAGNTGRVLLLIFRLLGLHLAPRAILKAVPFGVGLGLNLIANRALTRLVGLRALAYFEASKGAT